MFLEINKNDRLKKAMTKRQEDRAKVNCHKRRTEGGDVRHGKLGKEKMEYTDELEFRREKIRWGEIVTR